MTKQMITYLFNEKLAGEQFRYSEIVSFLDLVIDEINADLSSKFPAFSTFEPSTYPGYKMEEYVTEDTNGNLVIDENKRREVYENYDFFPDKYIRSVVIPGAAYKWFSVDEEGASTAPLFQAEYEKARFEMVRDYIDYVPYEFINDTIGGIRDPFYYDKLKMDSEAFGVF
jgi:hypothetical protein